MLGWDIVHVPCSCVPAERPQSSHWLAFLLSMHENGLVKMEVVNILVPSSSTEPSLCSGECWASQLLSTQRLWQLCSWTCGKLCSGGASLPYGKEIRWFQMALVRQPCSKESCCVHLSVCHWSLTGPEHRGISSLGLCSCCFLSLKLSSPSTPLSQLLLTL